jgi:hypothetical protein
MQGAGGFKGEREEQRKREASSNRAAWSTLFMRSDTVAAAVAAHYGVSKSQLLDASASDLPLRMALGEAQVCRGSVLLCVLLACLLACLLARLLACLLACLLAR